MYNQILLLKSPMKSKKEKAETSLETSFLKLWMSHILPKSMKVKNDKHQQMNTLNTVNSHSNWTWTLRAGHQNPAQDSLKETNLMVL